MKEVKAPKRPLIYYYLIAMGIILLFNMLFVPMISQSQVIEVDYGTFVRMAENQELGQVEVDETLNQLLFTDKDEKHIYKAGMISDPDLAQLLKDSGAKYGGQIIEQTNPIVSFLISWVLPVVIFVLLGQYMNKKLVEQAGGGKNSMAFGLGKSNAKVYVQSTKGIKFSDVAGEDEAKESLAEIVDYLHNPKKYTDAGASNDIEQATKLARAMITRYGMSQDFDMVALETVNNQYLGGDASLACSSDTQREIDKKVVELVKRQHEKAKKILEDNRSKLDELAKFLYEKETITGEEFMDILEGVKKE